MARVSILMNCYNGRAFLKQALDSVYAQTYKDWEIVFVDNCSTDNSAEILDQYDGRIRYVKTPEMMSLCQARVFARPFISGDFLCVLDVDDLWMPEKLEKQVTVMDQYPEVGICYTNTLYFSEKEQKVAYDRVMPSGRIFETLLANYFFSLETVMVRRSVMEEHQLYFNEKYTVSSDSELFIKLAYFTQCQYIDEILAKWRFGHGSESEKSLCLFPVEYETLLSDLSGMIQNFNNCYAEPVHSLKAKIDNMHGVCQWVKENRSGARKFFLNALKRDKKYLIPFLLSFFMPYQTYVRLRKIIKKV